MGTYQIDVTISDGFSSITSYFAITVAANQPPTFAITLTAQTCNVGQSCSYLLPSVTDPEGASVTKTAVQQGTSSLPSFISFTGSSFSIASTSATNVGTYTVEVTLSDGFNNPSSTFNVIIGAH